jgi:uncharacterized membrane protein YfcA
LTVVALIVLGFAAGMLAVMVGIGGGVIFVPSLVVLFGFTQHLAQGTSVTIVVPTAIVGAILHSRRGRVSWRTAALVATGAIAGALIGSHVALSLNGLVLRRLFAALLVVLAVRLVSR